MKRKPGLWFNTTKIEVEDVRKAHRKVCASCSDLPLERRLKIVTGAGRHATTAIFCISCGVVYLSSFNLEGERALAYLKGDPEVETIRK
jgi:RNase P subunit RPR2